MRKGKDFSCRVQTDTDDNHQNETEQNGGKKAELCIYSGEQRKSHTGGRIG